MKNIALSLFVIFGFAFNCAGRKLKPKPIPFVVNTTYLPSVQKETNICIGLQLNLGPKKDLDNQICQFYSGHHADGGIVWPLPIYYTIDVDYQVFRDFPLDRFNFDKNTIEIKERIYYTADGYANIIGIPVLGQCGWDDEVPRRVDIGAKSTITFSPDYFINANFKSDPSSVPAGYTCIITRARKDVTNNLINLVDKLIGSSCNQLNSVIQTKSNFQKEANSIWQFMNHPIKLNDNRYLEFNPKSFSISNLNFSETSDILVNTTLGLVMNPKIVEHPKAPTPLPKLTTNACSPNFEIEYDLEDKVVDFNKSPVIVDKSIYNQKFSIGRRKLTIKNIDFSYFNSQLVTKLKISGRAKRSEVRNKFAKEIIFFFENIFYRRNGTIYLLSELKNENSQIKNDRLFFETNSLKEINKKATWISQTDLLKYIKESLVIDQTYQILNLQSQFNQHLNTEISRNIKMNFKNTSQVVNTIFFYQDKIISRYKLVGQPLLTIKMN